LELSATRHPPQKAILMKNLVFALALVGLVAACKSTSNTSVTDPSGANMPKAGCCEKAAEGCSAEKKAACEGKKAGACDGAKASGGCEGAKAAGCQAAKPQG
jgi:hypothetical protein